MRHLIGLVAVCLLLAGACGGTATAPSPAPGQGPPGVPAAPPVTPGTYVVSLLAAEAPGDVLRPDCTPYELQFPGISVPIPVARVVGVVSDEGNGRILLRPDPEFDQGFELRLQRSGETLAGTMKGSFRDYVVRPVVATVDGGEPGTAAPLAVTGSASGRVIGTATGRMLFPASAAASCRLGRWMLEPR